MPIEGMTRSDKCIGIIERKVITDMRRAFPLSGRFSGNTNCMCLIGLGTRCILTPLKLCDQWQSLGKNIGLHHQDQANRGHYSSMV